MTTLVEEQILSEMGQTKMKAEHTPHLYRFASVYQEYMNFRRDYGSGVPYSMVEMHLLAIVCTQPGIMVGALANAWGCTKGAASQHISKLEKKGLVVRTKLLTNAREVHIYPTAEGQRLSDLHRVYDEVHEDLTGKWLLEQCTVNELEAFDKVMKVYSEILEDEMKGLREKE